MADALEQAPQGQEAVVAWHRVRALEGLDGLDVPRQAAAVRALIRAGGHSLAVGASKEAVAQLAQAVALLEALPPSALRDQLEAPLRCAYGGALLATRGPSDPDGVAALARGRAVAEALGDDDLALEAAFGLWYAAMTASEPSAPAQAEAMLALAARSGAPRWHIVAAQAHGTSAVVAGRYAEGLAALDRAVALAEAAGEVPGMLARLRDPLVTSHGYRAFSLWFLDRDADADAAVAAARAHAGPDSHPLTRCAHLALTALLHRVRGAVSEAAAAAAEGVALARREHSPFWAMTAQSTAAWALLAGGEPERAREALIASRDAHAASGAVPLTALPVQTDLVDAATRLGRLDEAREALARARDLAASRLSFGWATEVERQAARLALRLGDEGEAHAAAERAVALARAVGAVPLVARAEATLASVGHRDLAGLEAYVRGVLARLPPELHYHGPTHTLDDVVPAAMRLADALGVYGLDRDVLRAGALLHDVGFVVVYRGHEAVGVQIASAILPRFGFAEAEIQRVCGLIAATRLPQSPRDELEQILADADLDVLGRADFPLRNAALRRELQETGQGDGTDWATGQARFLRGHRYFTAAARALRDAGKERNAAKLGA
ncbi:MAG: HD domain-containing protein [Myxococcota bacterium]